MDASRPLTPDLDALARDELAPGERVAWAAQPRPGRAVLTAFAIWLFAVPWTAFSVFWTVMAASAADAMDGWGLVFPLFGTPFVVVGLLMLSAPWWAWRSARRTLYVVTDRRAVTFVATGFRDITVRSFRPDDLGDLGRTERPDGSGDLVFETTTARDSDGDRTTTRAGFLGLADVRAGEAAVRALADG